jgi:hypothetical protein
MPKKEELGLGLIRGGNWYHLNYKAKVCYRTSKIRDTDRPKMPKIKGLGFRIVVSCSKKC